MEPLESIQLLANIVVNGDAGDNIFGLRLHPDTQNYPDIVQVLVSGVPTHELPRQQIDSLTINAGGGNDWLIVDFTYGNPLRDGALAYNAGGNSGDMLLLLGQSSLTAHIQPSATANRGGSAVLGGREMSFTGVEDIYAGTFQAVSLITPNADDALAIDSPSAGVNRISGTSGSANLSRLNFANVGKVVLDLASNDAGAGDDTLSISADGMVAAGLNLLRLKAGAGANSLTVNGGTVRAITSVEGDGTLDVAATADVTLKLPGTQELGEFSIAEDATVTLSGDEYSLSVVRSLSVGEGATLDLTDNDLIVDYDGDSPFAALEALVISGYNSGAWTGDGIRSSTAAGSAQLDALGIFENFNNGNRWLSSYGGRTLDATAVIIKYTFGGDATIDGKVDIVDWGTLSSNWQGTARHWQQADCNYDGVVNVVDLGILSTNYQKGGQAPTTITGASAVDEGDEYELSLTSSGPSLTWTVFWGNEDMSTASGTSALLGYTYPAAGEYVIHVFAVQADGIGYFAGTKQVTVGDIPAAPSGLSAAAVSGHEINLAWTDNSNIEIGYQIEQSPDGESDWVPVAWTDANSTYHSLPGPFAPNTDYYFRVKAFTESAQSQYSNVADVTTAAWPEAPTGLFAWASSDTQIELAWVDNSGGADIILQRSADGIVWSDVSISDNESATDSGLTPGAAYQYRVFACNSNGESGYATVRAAAIAAPTGLSATAVSGHEINLSWTDNSAAELYYLIEVSLSGTGDWELIAYAEADAESITLEGPFGPNTAYYFRVAAVGEDWTVQSAYSGVADDTTGDFPAAPSDLEASVEEGPEVHLSWVDNSENEDEFIIQRFDGEQWITVDTVGEDVTTYEDETVDSGTVYLYRVVAANSNGESAWSFYAEALTPLDTPSAPTATRNGMFEIDVEWAAVTGTEPILYYLYRAKYGEEFDEEAPYATNITGTSFTDTLFDLNSKYVYKVQAVNDTGFSELSPAGTPVITASGYVTDVAAMWQSGPQMLITWTAIADGEDPDLNLRYNVYRSDNGGETYSRLNTSVINGGSYVDDTADPQEDYLYRVVAVNGSAMEGFPSTWTSPGNTPFPNYYLRIDAPAIGLGSQPVDEGYPGYPNDTRWVEPAPYYFVFDSNVPNVTNRHIDWGDGSGDDFGPLDTIRHQPGYPSTNDIRSYELVATAQGDVHVSGSILVITPYLEDFEEEGPGASLDEWSDISLSGGMAGTFDYDDVVTLSLGTEQDLPPHVGLRVQFYVSGGWESGQIEVSAGTGSGLVTSPGLQEFHLAHSGSDATITFAAGLHEQGIWLLDNVRVWPILADASVDSFNDKAHGSGSGGAPAHRLQANTIENEEDHPGVYIAVDDEDLDGDGIPGFADGFDLDGVPGNADDEYEDELMPLYQLVLSFPTNVGDTPPKIRLQYDASDPGAMAANPTWPDTPFVLPEEGLIRIWRRADTVLDRSAAEAGWTSGLQGDFVAPEVAYTEQDLEGEAFDEDGVVTLYIQGVRAGVGTVQFWLDVDGDGPGGFALADEVKYTALDIDIIGNSLNMEGFDPSEALAGAYGQMTAALAEQMGNNPAANPLGMIVIVNDNDDDGDGIVDWADGFNLDGSLTPNADDRAANPTTTPWATKKETFSKIQIKFEPNPFSDPNAVFYLRYAASPPTSVRPSTPNRQGEEPTHTLPQNGLLRLWTEDGYLARSKDDIRGVADAAPDTGYYVAPGWYHVEQWRRLGLNAGNNVLTLYVEAVKTAPAASYVTEIVVELAPDGEHWLPVPVATFTLRPVRIGLDVNDNGSLDDAVDGVMNYLPGYAGGVPVVSSVVSFNESLYEGHQMRIIAEGLGVGAGIDGVAFRIDKVTQHDGYAGNATDSSITAPGNRNDFSFFEHSDLPDGVTDPLRNWRVAELEQSSWSVPLWAKDYGGWARIEVLVVVGQKSTVIHEFTVPNDADGDELADRWERDMVRLWNAQYGATEDETPAFFADPLRTDGEPADPDSPPQNPQVDTDGGHNMPAHRSSGDGLTIAEEYRGFFLHGGGHDGQGKMGISPGHVRLTPVFKELLAETDIMLGVQAMPNAGEMRDLLNDVGRGMSDAFNGAGIRFYWWIDQTAEAHVVFDTEAAFDRWAFTRKAFRPLVHLMFIDTAAFVSNETYGITRISGSAIFVSNLAAAGVADGFDYKRAMRNTVAHELTHLLILNPGAGFDRFDHEVDPDPRDGPRQKLDRAYLMVNLNPENRYIIKYSDLVRSRLNLKVKKSVL